MLSRTLPYTKKNKHNAVINDGCREHNNKTNFDLLWPIVGPKEWSWKSPNVVKSKVKSVPLQAWSGPEGSRM